MTKIVLITGCSSGIGCMLAVALAADENGRYKVYATMRNLNKKSELVDEAGKTLNKNLFIRKLDVTNNYDIQEVVNEILTTNKRIDYVINSAGHGHGLLHTLEATSIDAVHQLLEVNFVGVVRVCKAVIPIMKQQFSGHIINIGSVGGILGFPFNSIYCASKFALEGFSESLAPELRKFNCYISIVAPGPVKSRFADNLRSSVPFRQVNKINSCNADEMTEDLYKNITENMCKSIELQGQEPEEIIHLIIYAMEEEKPKFRYLTSQLTSAMAQMKFHDSSGECVVELAENNYF